MTIFSGVVAILSPTLMSRLPTYAADKMKGPCALGTVLERMQAECGVACTRTTENVCMVQGEWEAIRKAYSFLDHHDTLNTFCKPSPEAITKKPRRDRSPEPPSLATTAPDSARPAFPKRAFSPPKQRSTSPAEGCGVPPTAESAPRVEVATPQAETDVRGRSKTPTTPAAVSSSNSSSGSSSSSSYSTPAATTPHNARPTASGSRSGAMKRKQGIPRKQVPNIGHTGDDSASDAENDFDLGGGGASSSSSAIAQDSPSFANGDSSIQIVAAWGNFKEENIDELPQQQKQEAIDDETGSGNIKLGYYDSDRSTKQVPPPRMPGTGVYTVQSDGQGGAVILPSVAEPVYVLNVSRSTDNYGSGGGSDSLFTYQQAGDTIYHSSALKAEVNKCSPSTTAATAVRKSSNGKIGSGGSSSTARKSTTPRVSGRKASAQRTILLVTKKAAAQAAVAAQAQQKGGKKVKVSPQRRRGIIQGDSPVKGEYTCSYCQKVFNTKEAIQVHEEVYHTGRYKSMPSSSKSPLFECTQCGKSYMSKHALEEHLYTHVGMRPFACPYCAASFNHRKSLRRHVQLHNNVKRFDCPQCSKTFVRKDALESHLRIHRAEEEEEEEEEEASGSDAMEATSAAE